MRPRGRLGVLVWLLVALTLTLAGVAYASPPDPTWIPGLYDDDDFDNVVDLVGSSVGLVAALAVSDRCPVQDPIALRLRSIEDIATGIPHAAFGPRAPPTV